MLNGMKLAFGKFTTVVLFSAAVILGALLWRAFGALFKAGFGLHTTSGFARTTAETNMCAVAGDDGEVYFVSCGGLYQ